MAALLLNWWQSWRKLGVLPKPGDLLDQPLWIYEAIELCEDERIASERANQRRQQDQAQRNAELMAAQNVGRAKRPRRRRR